MLLAANAGGLSALEDGDDTDDMLDFLDETLESLGELVSVRNSFACFRSQAEDRSSATTPCYEPNIS
eukprot:COSAG01_NODE_5837_length_4003_cov_332.200390_3_plen_67_part_00